MLECIAITGVGGAVPASTQDIMSSLQTAKTVASSRIFSDAALTEYLSNDETTVVAVDCDLNIMGKMANAITLLGDDTGMAIRNGRLTHPDPKVLHGLELSVGDALANGRRSTIVVPGAWGNAWHIVISPASIDVVLRIERRHIFRRPKAETLQSVLRLSQAEARVLCELICGHSVNECAEILDVSVATVRKHLAATLRKTCCSRQSELMRLVSIVT